MSESFRSSVAGFNASILHCLIHYGYPLRVCVLITIHLECTYSYTSLSLPIPYRPKGKREPRGQIPVGRSAGSAIAGRGCKWDVSGPFRSLDPEILSISNTEFCVNNFSPNRYHLDGSCRSLDHCLFPVYVCTTKSVPLYFYWVSFPPSLHKHGWTVGLKKWQQYSSADDAKLWIGYAAMTNGSIANVAAINEGNFGDPLTIQRRSPDQIASQFWMSFGVIDPRGIKKTLGPSWADPVYPDYNFDIYDQRSTVPRASAYLPTCLCSVRDFLFTRPPKPLSYENCVPTHSVIPRLRILSISLPPCTDRHM